MRERPILFSGAMVNAILAGQKTQTRRLARGVVDCDLIDPDGITDEMLRKIQGSACYQAIFDTPNIDDATRITYAKMPCMPSDRLWVREAWRLCVEADNVKPRDTNPAHRCWYEADAPHQPGFGRRRPGMFMPRWASRILLEVTDVRLQRLQHINEHDACAEGLPSGSYSIVGDDDVMAEQIMRSCAFGREISAPVARFVLLWDSINGKRAPWSSDPWIWAITFKRVNK